MGRRLVAPWGVPVLATTDPDAPEWRELGVRGAWAQGDGDLGDRLSRMLQRALARAPAALAVGTDSPGLPGTLLDDARRALGTKDAVLGPSDDGGFYLLGLRRAPDGLLEGLPWSSEETFERTKERLLERGLSVHVLPPWFDVDRPEDLEPLRRRLVRGEIRAPATARALARLAAETPRVSVVIPVLDEEARIGRQLGTLLDSGPWHEVLVVDGGSRDGTIRVAREVEGVRVLHAPRGRALQMNAGARAATGDVLLFLHADVELPTDAIRHVAEALADPGVVAGAFRTRTVPDAPGHRLAPFLHLADLRSNYTGLPYGDQAVFIRDSSASGRAAFRGARRRWWRSRGSSRPAPGPGRTRCRGRPTGRSPWRTATGSATGRRRSPRSSRSCRGRWAFRPSSSASASTRAVGPSSGG
ncbi:MAG: DUF2064 domain-containing protein [Holophagales bacterium]|nr:DUF2064 domain-containing protein [Holophagales bacterium]